MQFDYPDANVHAEKRSVTTTPMQKLFMLNSPFMLAQAKALARPRDGRSGAVGRGRGLTAAYRLLFAREPDATRNAARDRFLRQARRQRRPCRGWEQYAQVLLASNETLYVD